MLEKLYKIPVTSVSHGMVDCVARSFALFNSMRNIVAETRLIVRQRLTLFRKINIIDDGI